MAAPAPASDKYCMTSTVGTAHNVKHIVGETYSGPVAKVKVREVLVDHRFDRRSAAFDLAFLVVDPALASEVRATERAGSIVSGAAARALGWGRPSVAGYQLADSRR